MYRVLSLFAGIGGFDLGLERTGGFRTVAFCEIDPFCRKVLAKHWPSVPCYEDVRTLTAETLARDGIGVDCIVGGFPCQDISFAGKGAGLGGERSGLWSEYARLIGELRPSIVIVENVSALLTRGLDAVLGTMASLGYDAEWHCIPAAYVGAPHRRDRIWIVCHPYGQGKSTLAFHGEAPGVRGVVADAARELLDGCGESGSQGRAEPTDRGATMADALGIRQSRPRQPFFASHQAPHGEGQAGDALNGRFGHQWSSEPDVGGMVDGLPARLDGGMNVEKLDAAQGAACDPAAGPLPELRRDREAVSASSELCGAGSGRDPLPTLPCESGPAGRPSAQEGDAALCPMRDDVPAGAQQEPHALSVGNGPDQRNEALGTIWAQEPDIPRVAHGVKQRVDRLRSLGNAVVPQIPEMIGRAILAADAERIAA